MASTHASRLQKLFTQRQTALVTLFSSANAQSAAWFVHHLVMGICVVEHEVHSGKIRSYRLQWRIGPRWVDAKSLFRTAIDAVHDVHRLPTSLQAIILDYLQSGATLSLSVDNAYRFVHDLDSFHQRLKPERWIQVNKTDEAGQCEIFTYMAFARDKFIKYGRSRGHSSVVRTNDIWREICRTVPILSDGPPDMNTLRAFQCICDVVNDVDPDLDLVCI
jgi:hypothetical protein